MPLTLKLFFTVIKNMKSIYLNNIEKCFILVIGSLQGIVDTILGCFLLLFSVAMLSHKRMT